MVGGGNRDGVDRLVLKKLAHISIGSGHGGLAALLSRSPLFQNVLVDITERSDLYVGDPGETAKVVLAAAMKPANRDTNTIGGPKNSLRASDERHAAERDETGCSLNTLVKEVSTANRWIPRHDVLPFRTDCR